MRFPLLILVAVIFLMPVPRLSAQADAPETDSTLSTEDQAATEKVPEKAEIKIEELSQEALTKEVFQGIEDSDTEKVEPLLNTLTYYRHNSAGETALTQAILKEDAAMVKLLVKAAVINLKNKAGETPLTLAIKKGHPNIISLVAKRAKASLKNNADETPLFLAIETDDLFLMQQLIKKGAKVNRLSNGKTALSRATELNRTNTVALLIKNEADPGLPNANGDTPLYIAVNNGFDVIAGILLHKSRNFEKDANWKTKIGEPLLHISIEKGHTGTAKMLIDYGAHVNQSDHLENTALNLAASKGNTIVADYLLQHGADVNNRNIMGVTPITCATENGHQDLAKLLAENGANPEIRSYKGVAAADLSDFETVLIERATHRSPDDFESSEQFTRGARIPNAKVKALKPKKDNKSKKTIESNIDKPEPN